MKLVTLALMLSFCMSSVAHAKKGVYEFMDRSSKNQFTITKGNYLRVNKINQKNFYWYLPVSENGLIVYKGCKHNTDKIGMMGPPKCTRTGATYRFFENTDIAIWYKGNQHIVLKRPDSSLNGWNGSVNGTYTETGDNKATITHQFKTEGYSNTRLLYRWNNGSRWTDWSSYSWIGGNDFLNDISTSKFTFSNDYSKIVWTAGANSDRHPQTFLKVESDTASTTKPSGRRRPRNVYPTAPVTPRAPTTSELATDAATNIMGAVLCAREGINCDEGSKTTAIKVCNKTDSKKLDYSYAFKKPGTQGGPGQWNSQGWYTVKRNKCERIYLPKEPNGK